MLDLIVKKKIKKYHAIPSIVVQTMVPNLKSSTSSDKITKLNTHYAL